LEKIRKALAKARTNKAFREQHPVSNSPDDAAAEGTAGGLAMPVEPGAAKLPANLPVEQAVAAEGGLAANTGEADKAAAVGDPPASEVDVSPSRSQSLRDVVGQARAATGQDRADSNADQKQPLREVEPPGGIVDTDPPSDLQDQSGLPAPGNNGGMTELELGAAVQTDPLDGELPGFRRGWPRRHPVAAAFLAVLICLWLFHTFVSSLDRYVREAEEAVSPVLSTIEEAVDPILDEAGMAVAESWAAMIDSARDAMK